MRDAGDALRAAAYDAAYWQARYSKNQRPFEWFVALSLSDRDGAAASDAAAQLAQARPARTADPLFCGGGC